MNSFAVAAVGLLGIVLASGGTPAMAQEEDSQLDSELYAPAPFIPDGGRNQNPSEGKLKGETLRVKRTLLMVKDLKRSLDFYENVIGLEVYAVDQVYSLDQTTIGNKLFNTPPGTRRRIAQLNTSHETRGIALREIDAPFDVPQRPRLGAILFEASEIEAIYDRAVAAGATVIPPSLAIVPERENAPELRYMELGVIDPDGHTLAFFRYYTEEDEEAWQAATKRFRVEREL